MPSIYDNHSFIIPSVRTITECKELQASEMERSAAITLYTKPSEVKVILHFDSTGDRAPLMENGSQSFLSFQLGQGID